MKLRELAHTRTGDKGNICNLAVIAYRREDYPLLVERVTADVVKRFYAGTVKGPVLRYEYRDTDGTGELGSGGALRRLRRCVPGVVPRRDLLRSADQLTTQPAGRLRVRRLRWLRP